MRTLLLLRHAQAQPATGFDFDRRLTNYGAAQCTAVAESLHDLGLIPQVVLCSTAARTKETWARVSTRLQDLGMSPDWVVHELEELYQADPLVVRSLVHTHGANSNTVLVVGHEPVMSATAGGAADETSDRVATLGVRAGMPTASVAVVSFGSWAEDQGTLSALIRP